MARLARIADAVTRLDLTRPLLRAWRSVRRRVLPVAIVAVLGPCTMAAAQTPQAGLYDDEGSEDSSFSPALIGSWASAPDEMALTTEFDISVWGKGAKSVRTVHLDVQRSGDARLTVSRKVVDGRGRTVLGSASLETASLRLGGSHLAVATRREHDVQVVDAVRTYPDDPEASWDLDGLKVKVVTFDDSDGRMLEVRFDTPEGRGSFWETLRPARAASSKSSASAKQQNRATAAPPRAAS